MYRHIHLSNRQCEYINLSIENKVEICSAGLDVNLSYSDFLRSSLEDDLMVNVLYLT